MAILSYFISFLLGPFPFGVSDISYKLKWLASYVYLRIYKYLIKGRLHIQDLKARNEPEKVGFVSHPQEIRLESPFPESHLVKADDKIFFYGVNSQSECLIASINRLSNQKAESNIYLKLANGTTYQMECNSNYQQPSGDKNVFTCGGLQMYYISPMRRWRIFFSGFLKETTEGKVEFRRAYVKFSFLWNAASNVYDSTSDINEASILHSLANEKWKSILPPLNQLHSALDFYIQAGVILGTVCVDDNPEDYEMYLFGQRMRYLGDPTVSKEIEFSHMFGYVHKNGTYIHFGEASISNVAKRIKYGFIIKPNGEIKPIENITLGKSNDLSEAIAEEVKATIEAGRSYNFSSSILCPILDSSCKEKIISIDQMKFYLDGKRGTGFLMKGKYKPSWQRTNSDIAVSTSIPESLFPMVVAFTEDICQVSEITGGKGSSLGKLTSLSEELQTFVVPSGMVVTTKSYKEFITDDILAEIRKLEDVFYGNVEGDVQEVSKRVFSKIVDEKIPNNVRANILKNLKKIFGEEYTLKKFAVRSSATGEDTEQMSAAGQMDTYLGVSGIENILSAVKKCWASQFGFTAIQYKRRYGQCLNTPMAVVIQEMVACDVAGVIFTCNPVTGNSTTISIAANFGLGESVVSGSEEPDTIELSRDSNNELGLHRITLGSKNHKIISTDFGTSVQDIPENERHKCCISEENALKLGQLAVKIEEYYRSTRDIEWGMLNTNIYVFQSRPVTSGTQETDFEIEHEFDGPLRVENDYFSVSNTGEGMPGALSPLGMYNLFRMFNVVWNGEKEMQWQVGVEAKYFPIGWMSMYNHGMFCVADICREGNIKNMSNFEKATMIGLFGRVLEEEEIFEIARDRHGEHEKKMSYKDMYILLRNLLFSGRRLKKSLKRYENYRIPVEKYKTSNELFDAIIKRCCDLCESLLCILICNNVSAISNMMVFSILSDSKGEIDDEVYSDFSTLVTSKSDVESADVPSAIQTLAYLISKSIEPQAFKAMKVQEALAWLATTPTSAGEKFRKFIETHGHRCLMEIDMYSITWGDDPKPLVQMLQHMVGSISEDVAHETNRSVIRLLSQLKIHTGLFAKLKLMFLVPMSRKGVQNRETSKSLVIKGKDAFRKAYRCLAKLMVAEGRIPEEDILFFMTVDEIRDLLNTRSPRILAKAYHRQRLHPKMNKYIFPEIMRGIPRPINNSAKDAVPEEGYFSMKGIPVCQGVCKGYLRVAVYIEDAAELKKGEILLAYATDIGWTPYFPALAGVATELGGLISHGAVVSREYGLPCIVGLHGATRLFKTGDYVLLDANKGILQKIPEPMINSQKPELMINGQK